jgi:excinuclease ABC subunit B
LHGINPTTVYKSLEEILSSTSIADIHHPTIGRAHKSSNSDEVKIAAEPIVKFMSKEQKKDVLNQMFAQMKEAAKNLDFERAAELRDEINTLKSDWQIDSE